MDNIITYKSREVKHCPPHFIQVPVEIKSTTSTTTSSLNQGMHQLVDSTPTVHNVIRNWLHENIDNRFFIGESFRAKEGFMIESFGVAFEEPADATYFTLLLPSFLK